MVNQLTTAPKSVADAVDQITTLSRASVDLYGKRDYERSLLSTVLGKESLDSAASAQTSQLGKREHPFDFEATTQFQTSNVHHGTCIHTKVSSMVGLGFETGSAEETEAVADNVLNPLCDNSFQDVLNDVAEDFWQVGTGYMEAVLAAQSRTTIGGGSTSRTEKDMVVGLHHIPAKHVWVFLEDAFYNRHYQIINNGEEANPRTFARFGDRERFLKRINSNQIKAPGFIATEVNQDIISEVIAFRRPSSLSRWYGFPDWLSAVASIELTQCLHQFKYDFFLNRGVPEFLLFIMGAKLPKKDWDNIETALRANIGLGNTHKSLAMNISNPDVKVQLEKLAVESKSEDDFGKLKENMALDIVSAHRVPPLLAGIQIPGKLGATNELPNALMAFQVLVVGPGQRLFQQTLGNTLGTTTKSGLALTPQDFKFKRIVDEIDLGLMDTVGRMRTPAGAGDRDPREGLRD